MARPPAVKGEPLAHTFLLRLTLTDRDALATVVGQCSLSAWIRSAARSRLGLAPNPVPRSTLANIPPGRQIKYSVSAREYDLLVREAGGVRQVAEWVREAIRAKIRTDGQTCPTCCQPWPASEGASVPPARAWEDSPRAGTH